MKKPTSRLIQQFFDATEKDDPTFLRALVTLVRAAKSPARPLGDRTARSAESAPITLSAVREAPSHYRVKESLDDASFTVGQALTHYLHTTGISKQDAAAQLAITSEYMDTLLANEIPITSSTVAGAAKFFATLYPLNALTLRQWLITGLRDLEIRHTEQSAPPHARPPASTRIAARRKK